MTGDPLPYPEDLLLARQTLCRFLATCLVDPRVGSWSPLASPETQAAVIEAAALVRHQPRAMADPLARGETSLAHLRPEAIFRALPRSPDELNALYEKTFGLLVSSACPPYEMEYIDQKFTFQRSQTLADVAGFYRAFGLEPARQHPERQDHLALELEFLASLLGLERYAGQQSEAVARQRGETCRLAYRRFLAEHVAWWTPTFARLLSLRSSDGFYAEVAQFLTAWTAAERALTGVAPNDGPVSPSRIEPPEVCEGCALADAVL
jgi:TorA maturation chaperone TorD